MGRVNVCMRGGGEEKKKKRGTICSWLARFPLMEAIREKGQVWCFKAPPLTKERLLFLPALVWSILSVYRCTSCCLLFIRSLSFFHFCQLHWGRVEGCSSLAGLRRGGSILTKEESNPPGLSVNSCSLEQKAWPTPSLSVTSSLSEVEHDSHVCIAEDYCSLWPATVSSAPTADDLNLTSLNPSVKSSSAL